MNFQTPEQRSRKLQAAQKHLHSTQEQHASTLKEMQALRRKLHSLHGPEMPNDSAKAEERKRAISEVRNELDSAIARRDELRQQLEQAKNDERAEASRACVELVESARPDYSAACKRFITGRLESIANEAAGLADVMAIRSGLQVALGVRRDHKMARLPLGFDMIQRAEYFDRLRSETKELIDAGVIAGKDIPAGLRKAWNL